MGEGALCGACARTRRSWDRARAALRYDKNSRRLVLGLKHGDRTHLAGTFGRWMHRAGIEVLADADLLVPVPLHWTRLFQRRYNQAALLAQAICSSGGPPLAADWLVRRRRTPAQGHLGPTARERNVRGAFAIRPGRSFAGKRVVIIDDVLTTGANGRRVRPRVEARRSCLGKRIDPGAGTAGWRIITTAPVPGLGAPELQS